MRSYTLIYYAVIYFQRSPFLVHSNPYLILSREAELVPQGEQQAHVAGPDNVAHQTKVPLCAGAAVSGHVHPRL